ncbi:alpha/beta hydrolase family protein [Oceanicaulis sp. LC35]|uniref:alpha/beta hydrolase family protein n=1 Tax=Oceanicaulis sp. LC35 TaxID=3349635 RepID=UPI003F83404C
MALSFMVGGGAANAQPTIDLSAYARLPEITQVRISPNGEQLAMLTGADRSEMRLLVTSLNGGPAQAFDASSQDINDLLAFGVNWLSDRYLLVSYRERTRLPGAPADQADIGRLVVWDLEEGDYTEFAPNAQIEAILPDQPNKIIVSASIARFREGAAGRNRGDGRYVEVNLYEYDLDRDDYRRILRGTPNTSNWVLDANANPIARQDFSYEDRWLRVFRLDQRNAQMVHEEDIAFDDFGRSGRRIEARVGNLVAPSADGSGVWFAELVDDDLMRGSLFDLQTGEIQSSLVAPEGFDLGGFVTDWRTGAVIAASWDGRRRGYTWFDDEFGQLHQQISEIFPDSDVALSSWDRDANRFVISVSGGQTSTDYYLLDRSSGELSFLQTQYPEVPQDRIHPVETVEYRSSDGLRLWGYMTHPVDRPLENLPMVVLPHGGPQARDSYGFDFWAQPLAEMGYLVFQPQFRGSDGQGDDFVRLGHGEWGRLMQDDVTTSVQHFVEQGMVDADRVCIFGWSYGGYAALAGYSLTPDTYRCAIAGAPVSDILDMMAWQGNQPGGVGSVNYWTEYIGDWRTQRDEMIAISPARNIPANAPALMLIHGREDFIVPYEQSEIMRDAVQAAGKPVELVTIEGDGHNLLFRNSRMITVQALHDFLMEHNPPDPR